MEDLAFCEATWESWCPWLLNATTLSGSVLGLPFADAGCRGVELPDWRQLPMVFLKLIVALVSEEDWQCRWRLHKAEVHVLDRGEVYYTQACKSWRWAAEVVVEEKVLCHCYWGMGLTHQHPLVHGLVVRLGHDAESLRLLEAMIGFLGIHPLTLVRTKSSLLALPP